MDKLESNGKQIKIEENLYNKQLKDLQNEYEEKLPIERRNFKRSNKIKIKNRI